MRGGGGGRGARGAGGAGGWLKVVLVSSSLPRSALLLVRCCYCKLLNCSAACFEVEDESIKNKKELGCEVLGGR